MNLKESFRYQKFLNTLMSEAENYVFSEDHLLKTTKKHLRKAANPDADDFEEVVEVDNPFDVNDMITFMQAIITEKEELTSAINKAKAATEEDIDALTEGNKLRLSFCKRVQYILRKKAKKSIRSERGYMLNNEKNQVQYIYDVEETKEELFDRDKLTEILEKATAKSADVSNKIDAMRITTELDFTPSFNMNLAFDEVFSKYAATLKSE